METAMSMANRYDGDPLHTEAAIILFSEVLKQDLDPHHLVLFHNKRGMAYIADGRAQDAIKDFDAALGHLELDEGKAIILGNRAKAYLLASDFDHAISDSTEAMELNPSMSPEDKASALITVGLAHDKKGQLLTGIANYTSALELTPEDTYTTELLEEAYVRAGMPSMVRELSVADASDDTPDTERTLDRVMATPIINRKPGLRHIIDC